jgi:hypothetical protein
MAALKDFGNETIESVTPGAKVMLGWGAGVILDDLSELIITAPTIELLEAAYNVFETKANKPFNRKQAVQVGYVQRVDISLELDL